VGKLADGVIGGEWFNDYPAFDFGGQQVKTMAIIRRRVDSKPTLFEPAILHYKTLRAYLERAKRRWVEGELNPKNWIDFVEKSLTWAQTTGNDTDSSIFEIKLPSTEIALDAYPLLGLQELWYEYSWDGTAQGHATFFIADPIMAESTIMALQTAAVSGAHLVQFFVPFLTASPGGGKWVASGDLIVGELLEVGVSEWPFKIEVKFGNLPGQDDTTDAKTQRYAGTAKEVLEKMADEIGVKILWLPYPAGPTQLSTKIQVDLAGRPIRDALVTYMNLLGMEHRWFRSPGGGIPTVMVAWDNKADSDIATSFFSKDIPQEALDYQNFLQNIESYMTTYFASARKYLSNAGVYIDGIYNVLIPYNMDPVDAVWLAKRYEKSEHGKIMAAIQNLMARDRLPNMGSDIAFLNEVASKLAAVNEGIFTSHARFNMGMIKNIGTYRFKQPSAEALQQIAAAYPGGVTNLRSVSASQAAHAVHAKKQPDGSFVFEMPTGGSFTAGPNDPVYLAYSASDSTGGARVFPSGATFPGLGSPEGGQSPIYPFEVSFDLIPYFGIWPGLPTYIAGFPPLDGGWEFYKMRYELSSHTQKLTAFLRTKHIPLYVESGVA